MRLETRYKRIVESVPRDVLVMADAGSALSWFDGLNKKEWACICALLAHPDFPILDRSLGFHREMREVVQELFSCGEELCPVGGPGRAAALKSWREGLLESWPSPEDPPDLRKIKRIAGRAAARIPEAAFTWAAFARELSPQMYGRVAGVDWPLWAFLPFVILPLESRAHYWRKRIKGNSDLEV